MQGYKVTATCPKGHIKDFTFTGDGMNKSSVDSFAGMVNGDNAKVPTSISICEVCGDRLTATVEELGDTSGTEQSPIQE